MWCIGALSEEYRERMYDLLDLYSRPFQRSELVICLDEKIKQLLPDTRQPLPIKPGAPPRHDYEYARGGTCNVFVAEVLGVRQTRVLLRRVEFHYTPTHASCLNMAEIEIGILDRQCPDRRLPDRATITADVAAWQARRNTEHRGIAWSFTKQGADRKIARHYVS